MLALETGGAVSKGLFDNPLVVGQLFTFLGVLVTAVVSLIGNSRAKVIHDLVNSEFQKAQLRADQALREVAELRLVVAKLTGTPADAVAAVVAEALASTPRARTEDAPK